MATWTRRDVLRSGLAVAGALALPAGVARAGSGPRSRLSAAVREARLAARAPSVSVAAVFDGRVVHATATGWADVERRVRADDSTIYNVASVSKTVVAVAALQARDHGLVGLDDDVDSVLPFPVRNPRFPLIPITLRQLLTHTAGIRDEWATLSALTVPGDPTIELGRFLHGYLVPGGRWFDRNANFTERAPGTRYLYSNVGAAVAAFVVEAASGIGFDAWCRERIFEPLHMDRTGWHLADVPRADVAVPYAFVGGTETWSSFGQYGYPDYPDGLLRTTPEELGRFLGAISTGGGGLLRRSSIEEMLRNQLGALHAPWQGLLWYRDTSGARPALGHNGGDLGVFADLWFRPSDGAGAVVVANVSAWATARWQALVDLRNRVLDLAPRL